MGRPWQNMAQKSLMDVFSCVDVNPRGVITKYHRKNLLETAELPNDNMKWGGCIQE
jgi:hypothetical protein